MEIIIVPAWLYYCEGYMNYGLQNTKNNTAPTKPVLSSQNWWRKGIAKWPQITQMTYVEIKSTVSTSSVMRCVQLLGWCFWVTHSSAQAPSMSLFSFPESLEMISCRFFRLEMSFGWDSQFTNSRHPFTRIFFKILHFLLCKWFKLSFCYLQPKPSYLICYGNKALLDQKESIELHCIF